MLENLKRLIKYCEIVTVGISNAPMPRIVADGEQGTTVLGSPSIASPQVVIALPLATLSGNCDSMTGPHTFIIFALEKGQDLTTGQSDLVAQYMAVADLMDAILKKIAMDIGGDGISEGCPLLTGMELIDCEILPEAGKFGGWNGWSATITVK